VTYRALQTLTARRQKPGKGKYKKTEGRGGKKKKIAPPIFVQRGRPRIVSSDIFLATMEFPEFFRFFR